MFPVLRALKQECPANFALTEFYEVGQQKRAGKLMVAGSWNLRQTTATILQIFAKTRIDPNFRAR
jgi:hypothetical protein